MALDTYEVIWKTVHARVPIAGPFMAQEWTKWTFRELVEKRRWSWLMKRGQFLVNNQYTTGNVDVAFNSNQVTGHATLWTAALVGRQFRIGLLTPIYTVSAVDVGNQIITLDDQWGGATATAQGYQIYNAYVTVPADFHSFLSVYDPQFNWQLWWQVKQEELNAWDAQRAASGTAYAIVHMSYDSVNNPPLPRYEIWPHQLSQKPFPFVYETRPPDLSDAGATLPRFITGNLLVEGALAQAARWPGPDAEHRNPYFDLTLSREHQARFEQLAQVAQVEDDNVQESDVSYGQITMMPWAAFPLGDASFIQAHAI